MDKTSLLNGHKKVDLKEKTKEPLPIINDTIELENIGHAKFVTLYVE